MKRIVTFLSFLLLFLIVHSQTEFPTPLKIAENLYEVDLDGCNTAFLVTDSGIVVVDAGISPIDGWNLKAAIESVSDKPVRYVVSTHHHFDHVGGLQVFASSAKVIAQSGWYNNITGSGAVIANEFVVEMQTGLDQYCIKNAPIIDHFLENKQFAEADSVRAIINFYSNYIDSLKIIRNIEPDIVFDKNYTLNFDGQEIRLVYPGPAHSGSDCIVYFVKQKTVHVGDIYFEKSFPYLDGPSGASIDNWIKVLKKLSTDRENEHFICGHGYITAPADFLIMRQLLIDMKAEVKLAKAKGLSVEETIEAVKMDKYADYPSRDLLEKDIRWLFETLK
jgi:glyoxylase-like metal-dependent hydrolase (beta-lactamase superfamily II)